MSKELVKLMVDAYRGNVGTEFSKEQAIEAIRNSFKEMLGVEENGQINYYTFQTKAPEVFALMAQALDQIIPANVEEQFGEFAEVKTAGFGDKPVFEIPENPNDRLFEVAVISEGNNNLRRQKISDSGYMTVDTYWMGAKIYEDFMRFITGRTDWAAMVNNVAISYNRKIAIDIYNTFIGTYSTIAAPYKGTGAFDGDKMAELIQHVEAATGQTAVIVGTKLGLGKIGPSQSMVSQEMMNQFNQLGRYGEFRGTAMRELKQSHKQHTDDFVLDDKSLLILPAGGIKPVKVLVEGQSMIKSTESNDQSADGRMEYTFRKKAGIAVIQTAKYGIWQLV